MVDNTIISKLNKVNKQMKVKLNKYL